MKCLASLLRLGAAALMSVAILSSCSDKKWTVEGTVADLPEGQTLLLEAPNGNGGWYPVDTLTVSSSGKFSTSGFPFGHPELLRLTLGKESVYIPVDSIETVTVNIADAAGFATSATLSGSTSAEKLQEVNDLIAKVCREKGAESAPFDPDLKRQLAEVILRDPSDIVAYYLVFHRVGGMLLFSPAEKSDLRIIGAVANAYTTSRPNDPRTPLLKDLYLSNRSQIFRPTAPADTLYANEMKFPEISLYDENGKQQNLADVASKGNVVVLCFTAYAAQGSQALNVELNRLYTANRGKGFEIYQVGFDTDEFQWKESAKNLPWLTVYNTPAEGDRLIREYNIGALPAIFILNRNGDLVERVEAVNRLESTVNRYL